MPRRPHADMKIRLPLSLREKIKSLATANNRSMNAEFLALVEHGMQAKSLEMVVAQALNRMVPLSPRPAAHSKEYAAVLRRAEELTGLPRTEATDREMSRLRYRMVKMQEAHGL